MTSKDYWRMSAIAMVGTILLASFDIVPQVTGFLAMLFALWAIRETIIETRKEG